jgi:hypothetical protein
MRTQEGPRRIRSVRLYEWPASNEAIRIVEQRYGQRLNLAHLTISSTHADTALYAGGFVSTIGSRVELTDCKIKTMNGMKLSQRGTRGGLLL